MAHEDAFLCFLFIIKFVVSRVSFGHMGLKAVLAYGKVLAEIALEEVAKFDGLRAMGRVVVVAKVDRLNSAELTKFAKELFHT